MYAILIAIVGTPLYFGWRLVRALERRAAARNELDELTDRLRRLEDDRETLRREISAAAPGSGRRRTAATISSGRGRLPSAPAVTIANAPG